MENTNWIKIKKNTNIDGNEGFEVEEEDTSDAEIRAIEEKINQARKHFTKLPLFESLQPTQKQIKEDFSDKGFSKKEIAKFKDIIKKIKKYSDPETIIDNGLKSVGIKDKTKRLLIQVYILCICYFCIVVMATYNIYDIAENRSQLPAWMNKSYDFVVNSLSFFTFTNNYGLKPLMLFSGYKRFLISFGISAICALIIMNPMSVVILLLEVLSGNGMGVLSQLWRAPLIPIICIWSILALLVSLVNLDNVVALYFSPITFIATSMLSLILMILFTPISGLLFSLYWSKNLIYPGGWLKRDTIDKQNNDDVASDTHKGNGITTTEEQSLLEKGKTVITNFIDNQLSGTSVVAETLKNVPVSSIALRLASAVGTDTKLDTVLKYVYSFIFITFWVIIHIYASLKGKAGYFFAFIVPSVVIPLWFVSKYVKRIREIFGVTDIDKSP